MSDISKAEEKFLILTDGGWCSKEIKPLTQASVCLVFDPELHGEHSAQELMERTKVLLLDLACREKGKDGLTGRSWYAANRGVIQDRKNWKVVYRLQRGRASSPSSIESIKQRLGVHTVIKHLPVFRGIARAADFFRGLAADHLPSDSACSPVVVALSKLCG